MKQLDKASKMLDENISVLHLDEELILLEFTSETDPKEKYQVSWNGELWRCDCMDYQLHGLNNITGGYFCKHLLKAILFLVNKKNKEIVSVDFKTADKLEGLNGC